jgi:ribosomal protein S18 acetylase RimI-like enzyme
MKDILLFSLFLVTSLFGVSVREYQSSDKNRVVEIGMQDPILFFPGADLMLKNYTETSKLYSVMLGYLRKTFEATLIDKKNHIFVLIKDNVVVGFVVFAFTREFTKKEVLEGMYKHWFAWALSFVFSLKETINNNDYYKHELSDCCQYCFLESIAVDKDFRGKGYGKRLLEYVQDQAFSKGFLQLRLNVSNGNIVANRFYKKYGFLPLAVQQETAKTMNFTEMFKELS